MPKKRQTEDVKWSYGVIILLDCLGTKGVYNSGDGLDYVKKILKIHKEHETLFSDVNSAFGIEKVSYHYFSDTTLIVLKLEDDSPGRFLGRQLVPIGRLCDGLFSAFFNQGLFVRGSISVGKYIFQNGVVVGPAIDDAASYYERGNIIGIYTTPSTTNLLQSALLDNYSSRPILDDKTGYDLINHWRYMSVPVKGGGGFSAYMVNWPFTVFNELVKLELNPSVFISEKFALSHIPIEAVEKVENTLAFVWESLRDYEGRMASQYNTNS